MWLEEISKKRIGNINAVNLRLYYLAFPQSTAFHHTGFFLSRVNFTNNFCEDQTKKLVHFANKNKFLHKKNDLAYWLNQREKVLGWNWDLML